MEKKYQVFISSTYKDLIEERRLVMEALLQMNCFPVGMEYFNASDDSQWEIIKKLIDDCDYYVLIVAGRYGTVDERTGKSYTQMEFEYAVSQGKTVLRFVHSNIGALRGDCIEPTDDGKQKLEDFKKEVMKKYCKLWDNANNLQSQVILSLSNQFSTNPQIGWIKADCVSTDDANKEILRLREENEKLKEQLFIYEEMAPVGIDSLSQGDEVHELHFTYAGNGNRASGVIGLSWNAIFAHLAPYMVSESIEHNLHIKLSHLIESLSGSRFEYVTVNEEDFQNVKVQFIALGLIEESLKKRSTKDKGVYWTLTKYGKKQMFILKAIKKN